MIWWDTIEKVFKGLAVMLELCRAWQLVYAMTGI
jgi:hypothetical protein